MVKLTSKFLNGEVNIKERCLKPLRFDISINTNFYRETIH